MSFQGYLNTIQARTGKSPDDLRAYAAEQRWLEDGKLRPDVKAGAIVEKLKAEFRLGHGHAMAVVALLKGKQPESKGQDAD
jgi:hypothetical protein